MLHLTGLDCRTLLHALWLKINSEICTSGKKKSPLYLFDNKWSLKAPGALICRAHNSESTFPPFSFRTAIFTINHLMCNSDLENLKYQRDPSVRVCPHWGTTVQCESSIIIGCASGDVILTLCHQWADWNCFWHLLKGASRQRSAPQFRTWKFPLTGD